MAERQKQIIEPAGVLGIAAIEKLIDEGKIGDGERIGTGISGGNIDLLKFSQIVFDTENK